MIRYFLILFFSFIFTNSVYSKENSFYPDDLFHIDHMDSHNKEFALYFKGREKSILARGEESNYINDFPGDLYIYNYSTKSSMPLISYDWFPSQAKYFLQEYNFHALTAFPQGLNRSAMSLPAIGNDSACRGVRVVRVFRRDSNQSFRICFAAAKFSV